LIIEKAMDDVADIAAILIGLIIRKDPILLAILHLCLVVTAFHQQVLKPLN
jgi:hypothetical protein